MITIPAELAKQLPLTRYRTLETLYKTHGGLPIPLAPEAVNEGLELVDAVVASPVFGEDVKADAREFKAQLVHHADDWSKMKVSLGVESPLYKVMLGMQEEIQSLRQSLNKANARLDAYDEARFNTARRVLGLPPARSRPGTPPANSSSMYTNPAMISRLSADRLRDALEMYLDEQPPLEASRERMVKALRVCAGVEESGY